MVVLLIVGLMSAQAIQTMLTMRQYDRDRDSISQAQELVELGRIAIQESDELKQLDLQLPMHNSLIGELSITALNPQDAPANSSPPRYRIVAKYPAGTARQVTVSWEGSR